MKCDYDIKIYVREYVMGDFVYVLDSVKIKGCFKKLDLLWKGFGIVVQKVLLYFYKVRF